MKVQCNLCPIELLPDEQVYLELLSQLGSQLVAGELFSAYLVVLHKLLAVVSAPLETLLI